MHGRRIFEQGKKMSGHGKYEGVVEIARNGVDLAIQQRDELARLRQQLAAARLALVQYGAHDGACSVCDLDDEGRHCACDCGYEAAIKAAEDKTHNAKVSGAGTASAGLPG